MADKKKTAVEAAAPASDKKRALETALANIEKTYGKGAVMRMGENSGIVVEAIPTGSLSLDLALGIGGVPRGRIIEIYGPESSGKTTLALHVVAEAQKRGGEVAYIDAEHALDPSYARALGVDIDSMLISQPDTGEQGLEICEALVRSGAIDVVVVDSVAALTPRAEIEGDMGDSHVGLLARLMSQALRKLAGSIAKTNCVVIFINQLREKVGVMYGNPEVTTGGRALKFYASVRIDVRRIESLKNGGEIIGNRTRAKIVKNKVAPPFKEAEFDIMYGEGISKVGEIVDLAVKLDIIQKSGSWFAMGDLRIGQGRDAAKQYLKDNPEICDQVEAEIRKNSYKLLSGQAKAAARAAGRAVDVSAEDFEDGGDADREAPALRKIPGRRLIWLDDGALVRVSENEVAAFSLYAGMELPDETYEALAAAAQVSEMKEKALSPWPADPCRGESWWTGSAQSGGTGRRRPAWRRRRLSQTAWRSWAIWTTPPMPAPWPGTMPPRAMESGRFGTSCTAGASTGRFGTRRWKRRAPRRRASTSSCRKNSAGRSRMKKNAGGLLTLWSGGASAGRTSRTACGAMARRSRSDRRANPMDTEENWF